MFNNIFAVILMILAVVSVITGSNIMCILLVILSKVCQLHGTVDGIKDTVEELKSNGRFTKCAE